MSLWERHGVQAAVTAILQPTGRSAGHHLGPPYMTGYQLAIELERDHRQIYDALHMQLGGVGTGERHSVAQYLARELSQRVGDGRIRHVEGAMLSNVDVAELRYRRASGDQVQSSLTEAGFDMAIFRLRR